MSKRRGPTPTRGWQPLQPGVRIIPPETRALMDEHGYTDDPTEETWLNDRYVVIVSRHEEGHVAHLSIRRQDRKPARDWRDFQRIKDQLAGPDVEAIELYPARARVVDTANQYWLWCFPPGFQLPLGMAEGVVCDEADGGPNIGKAEQRPFDPADREDGFASVAPRLGLPVGDQRKGTCLKDSVPHDRRDECSGWAPE